MRINVHETIQIQLVDFNLNVISNYDHNFRHIYDHVIKRSLNDPRFPFVSTIDPYSYTMYNDLQTPLLIDELQQLADEDLDTDFTKATSELIVYFKKVRPHEFIRFIGD